MVDFGGMVADRDFSSRRGVWAIQEKVGATEGSKGRAERALKV